MEQRAVDPSPNDVLVAAAAALAHAGDLDAAVHPIVDAASAALRTDVITVFVHDPDSDELHLAASSGIPAEALDTFAAAVAGGLHPIAEVARSRQAAWDDRSSAARGALRDGGAGTGDLTGADLPLSVARAGVDVALGVVSFGWNTAHDISADDRRLATAIADLVAVAVDRAQLSSLVAERSEWLERMAHSDPLTGLANARTFARVLELEVARASRQGSELSVAIFDVDGFANVNRQAGRAAGDDVLRAVASILSESVRLVDTVARYGGDEFVLVAPGSAGTTVAQRVLDGVAALPRVDGSPLSVSAGVARFPVDGASGDELLDAAEAALERAKSSGAGRMERAGAKAAG
ncbi:MAG TPA: diguanylate cyclase [Candidatus Limnocylindrales bacterium]|nr:diguanylate cyclase [Candidatus Limnocylindrales bacterium]